MPCPGGGICETCNVLQQGPNAPPPLGSPPGPQPELRLFSTTRRKMWRILRCSVCKRTVFSQNTVEGGVIFAQMIPCWGKLSPLLRISAGFCGKTNLAPHFFFSWAQGNDKRTVSTPLLFFSQEKEKRRGRCKMKKRLWCRSLGPVLLSKYSSAKPPRCRFGARRTRCLSLFAAAPLCKMEVQYNRCLQFYFAPGGESKGGGRSPLLGRWGEGFQRERRIETPLPLAVLCLLSVCTESKRRLGLRGPEENEFETRP